MFALSRFIERANSQIGRLGSKMRAKPLYVGLGAVLAVSTGALVVRAADDPNMRQVLMEFNRPVRQAVQTYVARSSVVIPQIFRAREVQSSSSSAYAPGTVRYLPTNIKFPSSALPALHAEDAKSTARALKSENGKASKTLASNWKEGSGTQNAVNYCVRLCDGYAFPIGNANEGSQSGQEVACQLACPGAETSLYMLPAGAKDIDEAVRAGRPYSALPTALRYRTKYDNTCTCRGVGQTQSSATLLRDFTLRRGDIVMTRVGMRHFDGSSQFPYRATAFSDALNKVNDKRELAQLRAMEAASVRGILPSTAQVAVRQRVITEIRQAERLANNGRLAKVDRLPRGFEEMKAKPQMGPTAVRVIDRRVGLVAMN